MRRDTPSLYVAGGHKGARRLLLVGGALRHSLLAELQALFPDRHAPASGKGVDRPSGLEELRMRGYT